MKNRYFWALNLVLLLSACGSDNSADPVPPVPVIKPQSVQLSFKAMVGDQALACGTDYANVGSANSTTQIKDFRLFVHNVRLVTDKNIEVPLTLDSNEWQAQGVALLDFENASAACTGTAQTNTEIRGTVPDDSLRYTGLRFTVGIPAELNHLQQSTVSPFNVTGMNWGWTNGYKFIRFDVPTFNIHIGSTGCAADSSGKVSCTNKNRPEIALAPFNMQTQAVKIDYAALVAMNNISTDAGGAVGCMSGTTDPECNEIFTHLGLSLTSGENDPVLSQQLFSVMAK